MCCAPNFGYVRDTMFAGLYGDVMAPTSLAAVAIAGAGNSLATVLCLCDHCPHYAVPNINVRSKSGRFTSQLKAEAICLEVANTQMPKS